MRFKPGFPASVCQLVVCHLINHKIEIQGPQTA